MTERSRKGVVTLAIAVTIAIVVAWMTIPINGKSPESIAVRVPSTTSPSGSVSVGLSLPNARTTVEAPSAQPRISNTNHKESCDWPLDGAARDKDGILVDLKPYLHKTINNAYSGNSPQDRVLDVSALLSDPKFNPNQDKLSQEEMQQLSGLLREHQKTMGDFGPLAQRALGAAFHAAIEANRLDELGDGDDMARCARQQELVANYAVKYGIESRDFLWISVGGPYSYDPATGSRLQQQRNKQYLIVVDRAFAPEAFQLMDEIASTKNNAGVTVREVLGHRAR